VGTEIERRRRGKFRSRLRCARMDAASGAGKFTWRRSSGALRIGVLLPAVPEKRNKKPEAQEISVHADSMDKVSARAKFASSPETHSASMSRLRIFSARGFHLLHAASGNISQIIELARAAQPLRAVNHHAFAVDILRHVADEKCGEIGELLVFSKSAFIGCLSLECSSKVFEGINRDHAPSVGNARPMAFRRM